MAIHADMLEQARRFHQAGKLAEAERGYHQILQANGHDAEVWYLLGETVQGQGRRPK
jgi:predicted Zn-dependent protease